MCLSPSRQTVLGQVRSARRATDVTDEFGMTVADDDVAKSRVFRRLHEELDGRDDLIE